MCPFQDRNPRVATSSQGHSLRLLEVYGRVCRVIWCKGFRWILLRVLSFSEGTPHNTEDKVKIQLGPHTSSSQSSVALLVFLGVLLTAHETMGKVLSLTHTDILYLESVLEPLKHLWSQQQTTSHCTVGTGWSHQICKKWPPSFLICLEPLTEDRILFYIKWVMEKQRDYRERNKIDSYQYSLPRPNRWLFCILSTQGNTWPYKCSINARV